MAWDPRAQRLVVALGGAHPAAGCVALYDTRCDPILSARFIGLVALAPLAGAGGDGQAVPSSRPAAEAGWEEIQPEEVAEAAGAVGGSSSRGAGSSAAGAAAAGVSAVTAGDGPMSRPQLAFMPGFAQGALLAARSGQLIATVPMFFA